MFPLILTVLNGILVPPHIRIPIKELVVQGGTTNRSSFRAKAQTSSCNQAAKAAAAAIDIASAMWVSCAWRFMGSYKWGYNWGDYILLTFLRVLIALLRTTLEAASR